MDIPEKYQNLIFNLLIAEDNNLIQIVLKKVVQKYFPLANIIIVDNGQKAIEAIKTSIVDIVLMDIQMPVMNGYEATYRIRKLLNGAYYTPIIAMSADGISLKKDNKYLEYGFDDVISSPYTKEISSKLYFHLTKPNNPN